MKTIYLLRHAKSSWADADLADHDRPLKPRGQRDAPAMAAHVAAHHAAPETVFCSDSVRTAHTLAHFTEVWSLKEGNTVLDAAFYLAPAKLLRKRIEALSNDINSLMIVGHNPGITDLFNELVTRDAYISKLRTCGFAALRFDISKWSNLSKGSAKVTGRYTPKELSR